MTGGSSDSTPPSLISVLLPVSVREGEPFNVTIVATDADVNGLFASGFAWPWFADRGGLRVVDVITMKTWLSESGCDQKRRLLPPFEDGGATAAVEFTNVDCVMRPGIPLGTYKVWFSVCDSLGNREHVHNVQGSRLSFALTA